MKIILLVLVVTMSGLVNSFACSECQDAISKNEIPPKYERCGEIHQLEDGRYYILYGTQMQFIDTPRKSPKPTETFTITPVNNEGDLIEIKKANKIAPRERYYVSRVFQQEENNKIGILEDLVDVISNIEFRHND